MHYGLGLDCHGVGIMFMNKCSLLLCFICDVYGDNVMSNPNIVDLQIVFDCAQFYCCISHSCCTLRMTCFMLLLLLLYVVSF